MNTWEYLGLGIMGLSLFTLLDFQHGFMVYRSIWNWYRARNEKKMVCTHDKR